MYDGLGLILAPILIYESQWRFLGERHQRRCGEIHCSQRSLGTPLPHVGTHPHTHPHTHESWTSTIKPRWETGGQIVLQPPHEMFVIVPSARAATHASDADSRGPTRTQNACNSCRLRKAKVPYSPLHLVVGIRLRLATDGPR